MPKSTPNSTPQITPQWSHDLTTAAHSPLFTSDSKGLRQRLAFIDQAEKYASYDDLPPRLKQVYELAIEAYDQQPDVAEQIEAE